jgi:hypothetical protein
LIHDEKNERERQQEEINKITERNKLQVERDAIDAEKRKQYLDE